MPSVNSELIASFADSFELTLEDCSDFNSLKKALSEKINHLINTDFEKLVQLLYRIDINESKLKSLLINFPETNASDIITELIINRQIEKIETRKKYRQDSDISENDKW